MTSDQITAQNFKDFYNQIRPYLNGQVPTFANAFNRSDLYSTDEKIVGCWIDGKPLWQKVIDCGIIPSGAQDDYNIYSLSTGISFARIVDSYLLLPNGRIQQIPRVNPDSGYNFNAQVDGIPETSLHIKYDSGSKNTFQNTHLMVILQYTKTTDTAIKVGTGNDYSTDEQILGTWIDGKPVYQKTVDFGALPNATTKSVAHGISNLDMIIDMWSVGKRSSNDNYFPLPYTSTTDTTSQIVSKVEAGNIIISTAIDRSNINAYVTLQYTKTTD